MLRIIIVFLLFLIAISLFRVLRRLWSSSKETVNFMKQQKTKNSSQFTNVEDAEFREIPPEEKNEDSEKIN